MNSIKNGSTETNGRGNLFKVNLNIPFVLIAETSGYLLPNDTRTEKERKLWAGFFESRLTLTQG